MSLPTRRTPPSGENRTAGEREHRLSLVAPLLALLLVAVVAGGSRASSSAEPVAAYSFDAGGGTTLADDSGGESPGSVVGATWVRNGKYGGALLFDGRNDYVSILQSSSLDVSNGLTLEAWVRPVDHRGFAWRAVISNQQRYQLGYGLFAHTPGGLFSQPGGSGPAGVVSTSSSAGWAQGSQALPLDTWTHLAATYDGRSVQLYVNAVLAATSAPVNPPTSTGRILRIGGTSIWPASYAGLIDEVRVYDRALTASEISADMAVPVSATPVADIEAPTPPGSLRVTSSTATSFTLAWDASSDDVGVAEYGVYRGSTRIEGTKATTYTFAGLTCGTSYAVAVDAADATGNRSARSPIGVSTAPCTVSDTRAPDVPPNLEKMAASGSAVSIGWNASSDDVGVAGYGVYRNGLLVRSQTARSYTFSGLACGTSYSFAVDAFDVAGNRSAKASVTAATSACAVADGLPPSAPGGLVTSGQTQTSVDLGWSASTDNVAVDGYIVYRNGAMVSSQTGRSYSYTGLVCGTSYSLGVEAYDAAGNRSTRSTVNGSTDACSPPPAPTPTPPPPTQPPTPPTPSMGSANLWVDTNGGSCVRSAAATYSDGSACPSIDAAYKQAQPGDRILVKGGSYGSQNIAERTIGTEPVVIQPAPGETVLASGGVLRARNVVFEGGGTIGADEPNRFRFSGEFNVQMSGPTAGDRNSISEDVSAPSTFVQADGVTIRYSDFGPMKVCDPSDGNSDDIVKLWWWNTSAGERGSQRITFEYNLVHEALDAGCSGSPHDDAIHMQVDDSVIRGNRIWHCGTQCIFQGYNSRNVIIENNMIEETDACPRCGISTEVGVAGNITLRNNTIAGNVTFSGGTIPAAALVTGNLFLTGIGCDPAGTYRNNIYPANSGSACGSGARRGTPILSNGQPYSGDRNADWHLHPSDTIARNNGDTTNNPNTDIDGQPRPQGTIDAGADEIG